ESVRYWLVSVTCNAWLNTLCQDRRDSRAHKLECRGSALTRSEIKSQNAPGLSKLCLRIADDRGHRVFKVAPEFIEWVVRAFSRGIRACKIDHLRERLSHTVHGRCPPPDECVIRRYICDLICVERQRGKQRGKTWLSQGLHLLPGDVVRQRQPPRAVRGIVCEKQKEQ